MLEKLREYESSLEKAEGQKELEEVQNKFKAETVEVKDKDGKEITLTGEKEMRKFLIDYNSEIGDYFDIEGTDAQEFTTWQEHMDIVFRQGRLSAEDKAKYESAYEKLSKGETLNSDELKFILQPIKPVYAGSIGDNNDELNRTVYIKSSSFPLLPQLTAGLKIDKVRQHMEELQRREGKQVRLSFQTANKIGSIDTNLSVNDLYNSSFDELYNTDENNNPSGKLRTSFLVLDRDNFKIQQDTPNKTDKFLQKNMDDYLTMGSQMWKNILGAGISSDTRKIFPNTFDQSLIDKINDILPDEAKIITHNIAGEPLLLSGKELDTIKYHTERLLQENNLKDFYKQLGLNSKTGLPIDRNYTIAAVQKMLKKEVAVRNYPDIVADSLELVKELDRLDFDIPLWLSQGSNKFESLLQSIIASKIIHLKLPGNAHISASSEGFEPPKILSDSELTEQNKKSNIVWIDKSRRTTQLKATRTEDGKLKESEVLIASKFRITKNGKTELIDLTKEPYSTRNPQTGLLELNEGMIDDELLQQFSFRIPTSSHQSGAILRVVGFLPEASGDTIVVPKEHTKQIGEDFDIDKRNVYKNHYFVNEDGKIEKLKEHHREQYLRKRAQALDESVEQIYEEYENLYANLLKDKAEVKEESKRLRDAFKNAPAADKVNFVKKVLGVEKDLTLKEAEDLVLNTLKGNSLKKVDALYESFRRDKNAFGRLIRATENKLSKEFDKKLYENAMIDVYKSVYTTTDETMQKKINKILSFEVAKKTAEEIQSKINGSISNKTFTIFDDAFQRHQMELGADGKMGIGVHSNAVTMQAQLERIGGVKLNGGLSLADNYLRVMYKNYEGILGTNKTIDGHRTPADIHAENQNSSTDNVKAQIMGKRNENQFTINVLTQLAFLGVDLEDVTLDSGKKELLNFGSLLISQPIIMDYVNIKKQQKAASNKEYKSENDIIKELLLKYDPDKRFVDGFNPEEVKDSDSPMRLDKFKWSGLIGERAKKLSGQNLYNNLTNNFKEADVLTQLSVFELFLSLNEDATQLSKYQQLINMNTSGLGLSYFDVLDRISDLDDLAEQKKYQGLSNLVGHHMNQREWEYEAYERDDLGRVRTDSQGNPIVKDMYKDWFFTGKTAWKPTTTEGIILINSLKIADGLMNELYPYKGQIGKVVNFALNAIGQKDNFRNSKLTQFRYDVIASMRDYINSSDIGLFEGDATEERKRLFVDDENNKSLASFISDLISSNNPIMKSNEFLKGLSPVVNLEGGISIIKSSQENENSFDNSNKYKDFMSLLYDNNTILGTLNGVEMTPALLAQELATYAFLANDENGAIGFRNYINMNYLKIIGANVKINQLAKSNRIFGDDFITQFVQHNFAYAKRVNPKTAFKDKKLKFDNLYYIPSSMFDDNYSVETNFFTVTVKNKTYLYKYAVNGYERIPIVGAFGFNEYNPNEDVLRSSLANTDKDNVYKIQDRPVKSEVFSLGRKTTMRDLYGDNISAKEFLDDMFNKGGGEYNSQYRDVQLYELLKPYIDDNLKIKFVDNGVGRGSLSSSGLASYDANTNTISIDNEIFNKISDEYLKSKADVLREIILEEYIHSITARQIEQYIYSNDSGGVSLKENAPIYASKIYALYRKAQVAVPYNPVTKENYYTKDIKEFIAGVFIDEEFRKKLDNIVPDKTNKSLLEMFRDFLKTMFIYLTGKKYSDNVILSVGELLTYESGKKENGQDIVFRDRLNNLKTKYDKLKNLVEEADLITSGKQPKVVNTIDIESKIKSLIDEGVIRSGMNTTEIINILFDKNIIEKVC